MKNCKDIDFLDSYWKEAKRIAKDVKNNLPKGIVEKREPNFSKGNAKMYIVKFSDLKDTWLPKDIIYSFEGKSQTLSVLADKIHSMILKGRAEAVKRMVESICNDNIKKLIKGKGGFNTKNETLGYGHFRWNNEPHILDEKEIKHLKLYFKI